MPAALLPWVKPQFTDAAGDPVASGRLYTYVAGTSTPQPTYADPDLATANPNPLELNAAGQSPTPIYLRPTGYRVELRTAAGVPVWDVDGVEDVGAVAIGEAGVAATAGGKNVTSGYTVLATDRLVTVNSTGGANPCLVNLPPAADATQVVTIKNVGTIPLSVLPNGSDTIDGAAGLTVAAATGVGQQPSVQLAPDGVSAWYLLAGHSL